MKILFQFLIAGFCIVATGVLMYLMVTSELNYLDTNFSTYFGLLGVIAAVCFVILTQNDDNEETNPGKEKAKK